MEEDLAQSLAEKYLQARATQEQLEAELNVATAEICNVLSKRTKLRVVEVEKYNARVSLAEKAIVEINHERLDPILKRKGLYSLCVVKEIRRENLSVALLEKYIPEEILEGLLEEKFSDDKLFDLIVGGQITLEEIPDTLTPKITYSVRKLNTKSDQKTEE